MSQDFDQGVIWGRALSDIRHLQDVQHEHHDRLTVLETRMSPEAPQQGVDLALAKRVALVGAIWTAAASTAWNADSIAARLLGFIGR